MSGPAWLSDIFAGLMLAVAVYCAGRLVAIRVLRKATEVDTEVAHIVMGVAMAGVFAVSLRILGTATWEAVFGVAAAWFAWRVVQVRRTARRQRQDRWRCPQPLPHLIECGAMLYMFLALPAVAGKAAVGGMDAMAVSATESRFSVLALGMTLFLLGYAVQVANRMPALAAATSTVTVAGACPGIMAPRCAALCKMAMGVTMGYMLVLML